jgi:eukaryotic-like serine/threonine-protein kinase
MLTAVDSKGQMVLQPSRRRDSTRRAPSSRPDRSRPDQGRPDQGRPDQGGRRAAAKRWSAITVAGLAAAGLTTLIMQGFLDNSIDKADTTTEPAAGASGAATVPAGTGAKATGVFGGERRTVLHLAEVDKNLYLNRSGELAAHENADARSEFALLPAESGHFIESLAATSSGERQCLRVEPQDDDAGAITLGGCAPNTATRFDLVPTGKRDTHGHPTFTIHDQTNGAVEWSSVRSQLYLKPKGDTPVGTTVSFADRGALR